MDKKSNGTVIYTDAFLILTARPGAGQYVTL